MTAYIGNPVTFSALPAVHVVGNPVTFSALPAVHVVGNPVTFSAPRIWAMRATATGLVPIQLARVEDGAVITLSPSP